MMFMMAGLSGVLAQTRSSCRGSAEDDGRETRQDMDSESNHAIVMNLSREVDMVQRRGSCICYIRQPVVVPEISDHSEAVLVPNDEAWLRRRRSEHSEGLVQLVHW